MKMKKTMLLALLAFVITGAKAQQWQPTANPPQDALSMTTIGNSLFAGSRKGLYVSSDQGASWVKRSNLPGERANALLVVGTDLYAALDDGDNMGGIYKSSDSGLTWTTITPVFGGDSTPTVLSLASNGTYLYAAIMNGALIYRSPLSGISKTSWNGFNTGLPGSIPYVHSLTISGTTLLAGTYFRGVWRSPTDLANWEPTSGMVTDANYITALCVKGSTVLAGNGSTDTPMLYRSIDNGLTWAACTIGTNKPVVSLFHDGTIMYAGTEETGMFSSNDDGITWTAFNTGFNCVGTLSVRSFALMDSILYAGTDCGVFKNMVVNSGLREVYESEVVSLYPNPSNGVFSVACALNNLEIDVINTLGQKVYTAKINSGKTEIDLKDQPKGVYLYYLQSEKGLVKTGKIIVE